LPVLLALAALLTAGCQGDPRAERIKERAVALNIGSDPRSLDPSLLTDQPSFQAAMCFTRGLTFLDAKGNPQPELAESWTVSPDGRTWDFKLRPARWSDGEPVTADDFVYTWTRRVLSPKFGCEYAYQMFYVKGAREFYQKPELGAGSVGVRALAPDRLRVTLAGPTPFFLALLAHNTYYPVCRKTDEASPDWAKRAETYVGCGPFVMKKYTPGFEIVGEKNPRYWNAAHVAMRRLTLRMIEQESTERIAFENGELDSTHSIPSADLDALKATPEYHSTPINATYYLALNCRRPIFRDLRVRRALALAIDRKAIVERVVRGGQTPAFGLVPPDLYQAPAAPAFADAQYGQARRLLAEAGYPGGKGFPKLLYIYNTLEGHRQIAQVLQEAWRRELGIEIEIQNQEFKVLIDNRRQGNFDIARDAWGADFADPINFLELLDSKSDNNDAHWLDPHFDALLAAARAEADLARRQGRLHDAERYLLGQMPILPIYYQTRPYLVAPRLAGAVRNPMDFLDPAALSWKAEP